MDYKEILYEQRGWAAWIYLNRPEQMNSITTTMLLELEEALIKIEKDKDVRVLVLSGKGKAFCAGADIKDVLAGSKDEMRTGRDIFDFVPTTFNYLRYFPKPVIAALNGLALAGGLELTMCCDLVIASETAKLGDAHANFGAFPGAGGAAVLPRKIGLNRAKYLLFTGDLISATEMKDYGLVNQVVADNELEAAVQALADKLAEKSPLSLRRMKEMANQCSDQSQEAALRHEMLLCRDHNRSYDFQEGFTAFSEKRKPKFKGE